MGKINIKYQYYSKWRECWIDFKNQPTPPGEIMVMDDYYYKIRTVKDD